MLEYFDRPSLGTPNIICSIYFLRKDLGFKGLWVCSDSGKPVEDYSKGGSVWDLREDLRRHRASELCRQNRWEF